MAKNFSFIIFILLFHDSFGQRVQDPCVKSVYDKEIGVRELTNHNDGVRVEMYLHSVGNKKGDPWCAAFIAWVFKQCGVKTSINASSGSSINWDNLVYRKGAFLKEPQTGDTFSLYGYVKKENRSRVKHCGFFDSKVGDDGRFFNTVEGNTNKKLSVEGGGVYANKRSYHTIWTISRWIKD
jgi:hypothetical protein